MYAWRHINVTQNGCQWSHKRLMANRLWRSLIFQKQYSKILYWWKQHWNTITNNNTKEISFQQGFCHCVIIVPNWRVWIYFGKWSLIIFNQVTARIQCIFKWKWYRHSLLHWKVGEMHHVSEKTVCLILIGVGILAKVLWA